MQDRSNEAIDTKPWSQAVTKALAFAEDQGARIIGVTSDTTGVGVSTLSRELAHAYARYGVHVILVDASRLELDDIGHTQGQNAPLDLVSIAERTDTGIFTVDLAEHAALLPHDPRSIRQILDTAALAGSAIVVDLPPIRSQSVSTIRALSLIGSACRLVYLLCLSGSLTKPELTECIESCKINRIPLEGVIVNDWHEPFAWLAVGR